MGRTLTWEEARSRTASDLLQEALQGQQPLIVILEDGRKVTIEEYHSPELSGKETPLNLKPLPQLEGCIPEGWKDVIYGEDGSGRL